MMKGYKITDFQRKKRVGIPADSLKDLRLKTVNKWGLPTDESDFYFQLPDGTVVDSEDYFTSLPAQTLLIWVPNGVVAETDADILYKSILQVNKQYLKAGENIQEFFTEKMKRKMMQLASLLKSADDSKVMLSTRKEHAEWFEGLDTRAATKENYMARRAQDRIRTFFYKTKDDLTKSDPSTRRLLQQLLGGLQRQLKKAAYHGSYFDRNCSPEECLCNAKGDFHCGGPWNRPDCPYGHRHLINPYKSREERIVFQTWNLDHAVERSRSIVPEVAAALRKARRLAGIDVQAIYRDLFTTANLKLVHIVCHDKAAHTGATAGPYTLLS